MDNLNDISHLFEEAHSFYFGVGRPKDIIKSNGYFEQIMEIGKSGWGEDIYPDIFNDYVYFKYDEKAQSEKDYELAAKLYDLAAKNGSLNALNNLGFLLLNGLGVKQNIDKAEEIWLKAAESGDNKCQMNLVTLYKTEDFHKIDLSKAVHYCELATENGNQQASELLPMLRMTERRFGRAFVKTNDTKQENKINIFKKIKRWFK